MREGCLRVAAIGFVAWIISLVPARATPQDETKPLVEVSGSVVVEDGKVGEVKDESGTIVLGVHEGTTPSSQRALLALAAPSPA